MRWVRRALAQSGCGQNLVYLAHREGHALRHAHCDELFHLLKRREPRRDSTLYAGWDYVLVEAGPKQAATWRTGHPRSPHGNLPDLIFPADRSWLVSALWDDTSTCVGGPRHLIDALAADILVQSRSVQLDEDATPPGHHYI